MSFFKKLKSKLFKSSSKIDEGLDAIVSDGGVAEELEAQAAEAQAAEADAARLKEQERLAEEERLADEARAAADEQAVLREAARVAEAEAEATRARLEAIEQQAADAALAKAREAEAAAKAKADAVAAAQDAEAARVAAAEPAMTEAEIDDLAETLEAEIEAVAQAAEAPAVREAVVAPMTTLQPSALDADEDDVPADKTGLLGRFFGGQKKTVVRRVLDDDMLEQLEELLISADMGVDTALRVTANMAEGRLGKKLSVTEIKELMAKEIARIMEPVARPMPLYTHKPQVVLVVGVNGSGKTTTIGKLASQFKAAGKSVVIAAGDTFRAAAVEQLQVWGDRAGVPVLTAPEGSDPASLAFDAMTQAQADGADLLMIDTAGRLQNRADLMEELSKIVRVIRKKDPDAPHNTLLVLDATTGQNALNQVKVFQELADVSGLVMTKLDGTAKGGVLVALADKFGVPIHAIGVGEQIDDLAPFDPEEFAKALVGLE